MARAHGVPLKCGSRLDASLGAAIVSQMKTRSSEIPTVQAPTITYAEAASEIRARTSAERLLQTLSLAEVLADAAKSGERNEHSTDR